MHSGLRRLASVLLASGLVVGAAACGSDEEESTPTEAVATDAAPQTTAAPADSAVATTAGGTDTVAPTAAPSGESVSFKFAQGSPGLMRAFMEETLERVNAKYGHDGEFVELADSDLVVQGAAEGQFDMGSSTTSAVMKVIQQGAPLVFVTEAAKNQWTLMAKKEITSCADIDGKRMGLHSPGGVSTALYRAWYNRNCDGETPVEMFIEGSPNRLQALLEDQIDIGMIELEDTLAMPEEDFTMLANFTKDLADIKTNLIYSNRDFAAEHPDVVQAFVTELVALQREAASDPAFFAQLVEKWVEETAADVETVVAAYIEQGMLPTDGGMSEEDLVSSIALYEEAGVLDPGLTPADIADFSFIEEANKQ